MLTLFEFLFLTEIDGLPIWVLVLTVLGFIYVAIFGEIQI